MEKNKPPEDSMEPLVENSNTSSETFLMGEAIEKYVSQATNLNAEQILHEPTCMICSNPHREEIEAKWRETKKHSDVRDLIKLKSNKDISDGVIDNHMMFHCDRSLKEIQKMEYIGRLKRLNCMEMTTMDRIRLNLSVLSERLIGVNSITPTGDVSDAEVEKIKSDASIKIVDAFNKTLKLRTTLVDDLRKNGEMLMLPRDAFISIFKDAIVDAPNQEEKRLINDILTKLLAMGDSSK